MESGAKGGATFAGRTVAPKGDLVPVHGGLGEHVDRTVSLRDRKHFLREAATLPPVRVSRADLSTVYRIADGALSPLEGPMKARAFALARDEAAIESGGRRYVWGIPLAFPVTDDEARALRPGGAAAIRTEEGETVAVVEDLEVFDWDKALYVQRVYGTERFDHPGGRMVESDPRTKLVGGRLHALPQPVHPEYGLYMLSPRQTRALIRDRKWERALAFQTRNPLHRAHEYALVAGAERKLVDCVAGFGFFAVGLAGVYHLGCGADRSVPLYLLDPATGRDRLLGKVENASSLGLTVSPDGKTILYARRVGEASDLLMIENFR